MAIGLNDEVISSKKSQKIEKSFDAPVEIAAKEEKIKIKFNTSTMMILNAELFNSPLTEEDEKKHKFSFYPNVQSYKHFRCGQVLEVGKSEYENIKAYFGGRTALVNNERMGDLRKIYEERLAGATQSEREYIKANEHEFTLAVFEKPIFELVA